MHGFEKSQGRVNKKANLPRFLFHYNDKLNIDY